ncbi:MAG: S8 family serine peptidase, partial [Hyphomicrobium aestuarii]|nr:S8 family serine peptidase [Hyphomicrobium aestuarii]
MARSLGLQVATLVTAAAFLVGLTGAAGSAGRQPGSNFGAGRMPGAFPGAGSFRVTPLSPRGQSGPRFDIGPRIKIGPRFDGSIGERVKQRVPRGELTRDPKIGNSTMPDRPRAEPKPRPKPKPKPGSQPGSRPGDSGTDIADTSPRPGRPGTGPCLGGRKTSKLCLCPGGLVARSIGRGAICVPVAGGGGSDRPIVVPPRGPTVEPLTPGPVGPSFAQPRAPALTPPPRPTGSPPIAGAQTAAESDRDFKPNEALVVVPADAPISLEVGVASRFNLEILDRWPIPLIGKRCIRYRIPDGRPLESVIAALRTTTDVSDPQPNYIYRQQQGAGSAGEADGLQYALAKVDHSAALRLATGRGAIVGVIDTGIDTNHPDLRHLTIATFDATASTGTGPGTSPGASRGKSDSKSDGKSTGKGRNETHGTYTHGTDTHGTDTHGTDSHGTAIAGIIAAQGLTRGIAPAARIVSARAFAKTAGGSGVATTLMLLRALDWTVGQNARIVNLSFAGPNDPLLREAVTATSARNVIIVAAAGNNGASAPPVYPAAYDGVIAVTATDVDDRRYENANTGMYISIAAPGVDVLTATVDKSHGLQSGTSFAAAHITGIIALMLERDPELTAEEARALLSVSALDLGPAGADHEFGAGRANANAALRAMTATADAIAIGTS